MPLCCNNCATAFARAHNLPRVSCAVPGDTAETICLLRPATTTLSGITVRPPPGAFLRLTFAVSQTGLNCTSSAAELSATDPASKKTFYERDTVTPMPC